MNDALYERVLATKEDPALDDRSIPQRRILTFCAERGTPCPDLPPSLRRAERAGRTDQLRDTHWNARGDRVAGEAIADFLDRTTLAHRRAARSPAGAVRPPEAQTRSQLREPLARSIASRTR